MRERAVMLLANYEPNAIVERPFKYHAESMLEVVQERLSDDSWGVRRSACEVLGRWGDPRALTGLRGATSDAVEEVSLAAREALSRIRERQAKAGVGPASDGESTGQSSS